MINCKLICVWKVKWHQLTWFLNSSEYHLCTWRVHTLNNFWTIFSNFRDRQSFSKTKGSVQYYREPEWLNRENEASTRVWGMQAASLWKSYQSDFIILFCFYLFLSSLSRVKLTLSGVRWTKASLGGDEKSCLTFNQPRVRSRIKKEEERNSNERVNYKNTD